MVKIMKFHSCLICSNVFLVVDDFLKNRTKFLLRRQAFASLQHGFLRSVENGFIYNFITPNGVWENVFLYNIDTFFVMIGWQMLCLMCHWQMFLPGRCFFCL